MTSIQVHVEVGESFAGFPGNAIAWDRVAVPISARVNLFGVRPVTATARPLRAPLCIKVLVCIVNEIASETHEEDANGVIRVVLVSLDSFSAHLGIQQGADNANEGHSREMTSSPLDSEPEGL